MSSNSALHVYKVILPCLPTQAQVAKSCHYKNGDTTNKQEMGVEQSAIKHLAKYHPENGYTASG
jgi:hypothetical protein